jgi:hypothetical protein
MAEGLDSEFELFDKAVKARDVTVHAKWTADFEAWTNGDRSGLCPFETEDAFKCTSSSSFAHSFEMADWRSLAITSKDIKKLLDEGKAAEQDNRRQATASQPAPALAKKQARKRNTQSQPARSNIESEPAPASGEDDEAPETGGIPASLLGYVLQAVRLEALQ